MNPKASRALLDPPRSIKIAPAVASGSDITHRKVLLLHDTETSKWETGGQEKPTLLQSTHVQLGQGRHGSPQRWQGPVRIG